ncbi:unnamed protein product, partial [Choristocarpus tenellus]
MILTIIQVRDPAYLTTCCHTCIIFIYRTVGQSYISCGGKLLGRAVTDQLTRGHMLDVGVTARSRRPLELTLTNMATIHTINSNKCSSSVRQVIMKMATKGLNSRTSTINRLLDDMEGMPNHCWIKPKLKWWQKVWRMDFVCDQVDR